MNSLFNRNVFAGVGLTLVVVNIPYVCRRINRYINEVIDSRILRVMDPDLTNVNNELTEIKKNVKVLQIRLPKDTYSCYNELGKDRTGYPRSS